MMLSRSSQCRYFLSWKLLQSILSQNNKSTLKVFRLTCSQHFDLKFRFFSSFPASVSREGGFSSRYHPGTFVEQADKRLKDTLSDKESLNYDEWAGVKDSIMYCFDLVTEKIFTNLVMDALLDLNKVNLADSFLKYSKEANLNLSILTYMKYMTLCSKNVDSCGEEIVLKILEKVKPHLDSLPILDFKRTEYIIHGLCATKHWRDSFHYLKKYPLRPSVSMRSSIACAAIKNGDEKLAWEMLIKGMRADEQPKMQVFKQFILHGLTLLKHSPKKSNVFILKLFDYIQNKEIIVEKEIVRGIKTYFQKESPSWKISVSKIERTGECSNCKKFLQLLDLTDDEFMRLKLCFLERSVKKQNIFINTTEKEFDNFIRFLDRRKPYDIVLDGLNAAYTNPDKRSPKSLANQLLKIVELLTDKKQRLLVLGRYQMKFWPKPIMQKIAEIADIFLTHNISQDDPFVVYAALSSGPKTLFLSSDLMRDHISRLDNPAIIQLFKKWQQSHQIYVLVDDNQKLNLIEPLQHSINLQGNMEEGWHIPFDDKFILDPYEHINNWLCIQRKK